ncbi:MAG: hypothetical protein ACKPKO_54280, partial [Candidatus Fonsibacter sp.]
AAPGAPDTAHEHHLTTTKSFGNPLAIDLAPGRPTLCNPLHAPPEHGNTTTTHHIWYRARRNAWYNLGYLLAKPRKRKLLQSNAWQATMTAWNDGLFTALATHMIVSLSNETAVRKESGLNFDKDELNCGGLRRYPPRHRAISTRHGLAYVNQ